MTNSSMVAVNEYHKETQLKLLLWETQMNTKYCNFAEKIDKIMPASSYSRELFETDTSALSFITSD